VKAPGRWQVAAERRRRGRSCTTWWLSAVPAADLMFSANPMPGRRSWQHRIVPLPPGGAPVPTVSAQDWVRRRAGFSVRLPGAQAYMRCW